MSKKEQNSCCGTTCDKKKVTDYIEELESKSVEAMFEHFSDMIAKTRCKTLTIKSIKEWAGIKEED